MVFLIPLASGIFCYAVLALGLFITSGGVAAVVMGNIGKKSPDRIRFIKSKKMSIIMIIIGVIAAVIGLAILGVGGILGYVTYYIFNEIIHMKPG